jgi:hypothetical protein
MLVRHEAEKRKDSSYSQCLALPRCFLLYIRAQFALQTFILFVEISFISKSFVNKNMSDIRSLPKFSFGDIEKYIKDNLNKVCGGAANKHMKNSMVSENSFALHSEKGHILRIIIKTDGVSADITSNVKHSMGKKNVCCVNIYFADLNMLSVRL